MLIYGPLWSDNRIFFLGFESLGRVAGGLGVVFGFVSAGNDITALYEYPDREHFVVLVADGLSLVAGGGALVAVGLGLAPEAAALGVASAALGVATFAYTISQGSGSCPCQCPPSNPPKTPGDTGPYGQCPIEKPKDPNNIIGPAGFGDGNFVSVNQVLPYQWIEVTSGAGRT